MAWLVVLGVIALPVIEFALFVQSSQMIGLVPTVALALAAGIAGLALLRRQGLAILFQARAQLARGRMPVEAGFDALCLAVAGVLLVLPGFLTDALALLLLLPPVRQVLRLWLAHRVHGTAAAGPRPRDAGRPPVIEAEYHVVDGERKGP